MSEPTVEQPAAEREPDHVTPIADMTAAEAAELRTLFAGNPVINSAEHALRTFGVRDGESVDAVKLLLAWPDFDELTEREVRGVAARFVPEPDSLTAATRTCGDLSNHEPHEWPDAAGNAWYCEGGWTVEQFAKVFGKPEPDGLTPEQVEMDRQATALDGADDHFVIGQTSAGWPGTDLGDEDDPGFLMPAPGCGHPMPQGADCCISTQTPPDVRVIEAQGLRDLEAATRDGQPITAAPGVEVEPEPERTVTLERLTPELLAEEEERRRVEAREQGVSFEPIPANATVAVVARVGGQLGGVWDTDADWMCTRADLLVAMLRSASDFAADGEADLLMPDASVLAALDGRPDAQLLTAPVHVLALDVEAGMLLRSTDDDGDGAETLELITAERDCDDPECVNGATCIVLTVGGHEDPEVHFNGYSRIEVRIPVSVTR